MQVTGSITPRLWTPPLRELTPDTSYGFEVIEFARNIGLPLDPWQEWLAIHLGELLENGRPRFRKVLVLVSRQNGKTSLLAVLSLYWLFKAGEEMNIQTILGLSTNLGYAKEAWNKAMALANEAELEFETRRAAGEEAIIVGEVGSLSEKRYKIAASNRKGGRSLTVDRIIVDELREHTDFEAMDAVEPTMTTRTHGQQFMISNQGADDSVVLDSYRKEALSFIESGEGDERLGLFEWSAPDGSDPEDVDALCQANPNIGYRLDLDDLLRSARSAKAAGGARLAGFRTEHMCQRVLLLDPAVDPDSWLASCYPGTLDDARDRLAMCLDVSTDGSHATLSVAAQYSDGSVRVELVKAWEGSSATAMLRRDLPGLIRRVKPRVFGWFPSGGAAAIAADINFPDVPRLKIEAIRGDVTAVCMGFSDMVKGKSIKHSDDPLLNAQVGSAERMWQGDSWRFIRRGTSPVDAVYSVAGSTHLARTLPPPKSKPVVIPI